MRVSVSGIVIFFFYYVGWFRVGYTVFIFVFIGRSRVVCVWVFRRGVRRSVVFVVLGFGSLRICICSV